MKEKLSKQNKVILAIVTISLLATFGVLTYAYFSASGVTNNATASNVITLTSNYGNIIIDYKNGNRIDTESVVLLKYGNDYNEIMKFSIENTGTVTQSVVIHWKDLINNFCRYEKNGICTNINTDTDVRNEINYTLYECNNETNYNDATTSDLTGCTNTLSEENATVPSTRSTARIHTTNKVTLNGETKKYYIFKLTIENVDDEQNYNQNKSMSGTITVDSASNTTLAQAIEKKYTAVSDENIDFSYTSEGCNNKPSGSVTCQSEINETQVTNGLYINNKVNIADDPTQGKIKYFRGNVNNYVEFGVYTSENYHPTTYFTAEQYPSLALC